MSNTHMEDLSNEIFYEIFEYIEYYDLFNAFSNLNNRFENLLNYSFLSLKLNVNSESVSEVRKYCQQFMDPNKHRIVSLHLNDCLHMNASPPLHFIDSSFHRLESLIFNRIQHDQFISLLPVLTSLSRLFSITVHFNDNIVNLTEIYRLIFHLPFLKKLELSAKGYSLTMSLPINTFEQHSHIERMIINHACNLTELITLLSYTPLLAHLTCIELSKQHQYISQIVLIKMLKLTRITFNMCNAMFDDFEIFIQKICKQLRVLCINTSQDAAYLDAIRWERLISQHMPYLRVFNFEYHEYHYQSIELSSHNNQLNQFTSSFWVDRGWFFQIIADIDYWPPIKISYSIRPDGKSWCPMHEENIKIKLAVDRLYFAASRETLANEIFSFISTFQITHLIVDCKKCLYTKFLQLLCILPNLNSLGIFSLSFFKLKCSSPEETDLIQSWSKKNKITKLELRSFIEQTDLEKIQFFIDLCTQMKYLQVKCENTWNLESILRYILSKNIAKFSYFNFFCLWVPITSDNMIKQLQTIINLEKLIHDYTMTRTSDKIYLQWTLK